MKTSIILFCLSFLIGCATVPPGAEKDAEKDAKKTETTATSAQRSPCAAGFESIR